VFGSLQREDVRQIGTRDGRAIGARAGGDDQLVVMNLLASGQRDLAAGVMDGGRLDAGADLDVTLAQKTFRREMDQLGQIPDLALDVVGQSTGRVGNDRPFFEDHDLEVLVEPARARGGAQSRRDAADDDQAHAAAIPRAAGARIRECRSAGSRGWGKSCSPRPARR